jgi:hypothetical protein
MLENAPDEEEYDHRREDNPPTRLAPSQNRWDKEEWGRVE